MTAFEQEWDTISLMTQQTTVKVIWRESHERAWCPLVGEPAGITRALFFIVLTTS